jgi:hypothetical protein
MNLKKQMEVISLYIFISKDLILPYQTGVSFGFTHAGIFGSYGMGNESHAVQ